MITQEPEPVTEVTPQTFEDVARAVKQNDSFPSGDAYDGYEPGICEDGFVFDSRYGRGAFVGLKIEPDVYIMGLMKRKTETVGRNEPRIETHQNTHTEVDFRRVEYSGDITNAEAVVEKYNEADSMETGYYHGYRLQQLSKTLDEIFDYYDMEQ